MSGAISSLSSRQKTASDGSPPHGYGNDDMVPPSASPSGPVAAVNSPRKSPLRFWVKRQGPSRTAAAATASPAVVLSPSDLKRDLDEELHYREGGDAFISTMGNARVAPRRLTTRGAVKGWLTRLGFPALSRALGPSLEDQVHLFDDDFVLTAQTGDVVLVERKSLFEHRRVSSDILRGVAGTVSHHFLPKRAAVEPWTDVGLVVEITLPARNKHRHATKTVVSIDDNGAILIRFLDQFVGEVHADASTCALRRLSSVVPCPADALPATGASHNRTLPNSNLTRVAAADNNSVVGKPLTVSVSMSPNQSADLVHSRASVMANLTACVQAIVDFELRTNHDFDQNTTYRTGLPMHISYHDLMRASSVASCGPCIGALDAAARRALRTSKYPSVDDVNNLIQIFFTIDRDQIGSVPIAIVREFVDPTMQAGASRGSRADGAAAEGGRPLGALVRSREEIEKRLRDMDINGDGVISLEEFVHAFFREVRGAAEAPVAAGSSLVHRGSVVGDLRGVLQAEFVAALLFRAGCIDIRDAGVHSTRSDTNGNSASESNPALATGDMTKIGNNYTSEANAWFPSSYLEMSDYFLPSSFSSHGPVAGISDAVAASARLRRQGSTSSKSSAFNSLLRIGPVPVAPSSEGSGQSVVLPSPVHVRNDAEAAPLEHAVPRQSPTDGNPPNGTSKDAVRVLPGCVAATRPWLAWEPEVFLVHRDAHAWF